MDNSVEKQSSKKSWITDGIIIAASPVMAYILLYCYEAGFIDSFMIPREFMAIELPSVVLIAALTLALISSGMFLIIPLIRSKIEILQKFGWILLIGAISLPTFLLSLVKMSKLISAVFLVIYLLIIVSLLISRRKITIVDYFNRYLGHEITFFTPMILLLLSGGILANVIGLADAQTKEEFLIIKTSSEMVVLRIYGDKLICAPFDRTKKEVKRTFSILKIAEDSNLKLSLEKVGPLHMEKEPTEVLKKSISAPTDSLEGVKKK